jgi:ATP-dependent helicase/nuclease subunit A
LRERIVALDFPLTDEQKAAAETSGVSVVLTAGAGCGKTGTITARFLYLLGKRDGPERLASPEDRVAPGRIGVLTFTNKAAAELRHRIRKACEAERNRNEARPDAQAYWRLIEFAVDGVTISTYHAFYDQLCREFAETLELDPETRLLDERIAAGLKREAARAAVRERLSGPDSVLIEYAARHRLDGVVDQLVTLIGLGEHQTHAAEIARLDAETLKDRWISAWEERLAETADALQEAVERVLALPRQGFTPAWIAKMDKAAAAMEGIEDDRIGAVVEAAESLGGQTPKRPDLVAALAELKEVKQSPAFDLIKANLELTDEAAAETILLARMVETTRQTYSDLKRRRRSVDFDDLIEKAKELTDRGIALGGASGIRFEHLLVDEFQDTDRLQAEVLKALAGPAFDRGRLFVVGDVKQAIYRFRGADPDAILRLRHELPEEGRLRLTRNYRSRKPIVDFVNLLAASMYGSYQEEDPRLEAGAAETASNAPESAAIEFLWTVLPKPDENHEAPGNGADTVDELGFAAHRSEAATLATHLRQRFDAGIAVRSGKNGDLVPAQPGDVVLLTRSRTHWWIYERALREHGFGVHQDSVGGFFGRQEVRDLIGLLAVVENRMDDVRLAACLRSPIFGVSDEALFLIAERSAGSSFAERFWRFALADNALLREADRAVIDRARTTILELYRAKASRRPSEVVRQAIETTGFDAIVRQISDEPARAVGNLERLVDDARSFDHDPDFGWSAMIRQWLADIRSGGKSEEAVIAAPADKIRFLTIHSAKGLEFPMVVMPGLHAPMTNRTGSFVIDPEHGLLTRSRSSETDESASEDHPGLLLAKAAVKVEEEKETDNLLYVATTRAKDHLLLSAVWDPAAVNKNGSPKMPGGPFLKRVAAAFDLGSGRPWAPGDNDVPAVAVFEYGEDAAKMPS